MAELSPNSTVSHYRIVSKLGAGGMGEVWLAEDTRLDRKVALKILPAEFTQDSERVRRFTQEAKAASALNHPNIITVYDIGECETGRFIVMELVAGKTLRTVIASDNSIDTLFTLGAQMARALSAAHAAGITHRDIKPDNIMVRDDGYLKMLDFGLARLLPNSSSDPEAATLAQQTSPGTVMGTLAYMSPEQASGQTAGSPSDVFSLGIILYELATGKHPFKSESMIGYLHAITTQMPSSATSHKSDLPVAVDELILQMLEKDANSRPRADEVAQALHEIEKFGTSKTLPIRVAISRPVVQQSSSDAGFWIAVLPFKYRGSNGDLEALADGLSEDIITGLSRFQYLRVVARSSTLRFTGETADVRAVGKELGARYVLEGSLRQAGSTLRVSAQLVDTVTGAHLWAESYDRPFNPEQIFALQDELVPRIVATVADQHGVLIHSIAEVMRNKSKDRFTPDEAVISVFGFHERMTPEEHATLRDVLERVVHEHPDHGNCWAMLETLYADEYMFGFNVKPDPLGRALAAAQRAVELAPSSNLASQALAQAYFFHRDLISFRAAAERTIALNPMDGATVAVMGLFIACSGDWARGCAVAESAMQLNPHFPGWYRLASIFNAYQERNYHAALEGTLRVNIPGYFWTLVMTAAVHGQLGNREAAAKALTELLVIRPDFEEAVSDDLSRWFQPALVEHLMEGLRKAGITESRGIGEGVTVNETNAAYSSADRSGHISLGSLTKSIAVLPFHNLSGDSEQEFFADGITEEILNALASIQGLRVAGRSSAFSFKGKNEDLRSVGAKLNVGTILEGTLRRSGDRLRITAQLIDASNGYQIWSERYDRVIDDIFNVQDEIASTIANRLQLSFSEEPAPEQPPTRNIEAYELYLKGRGLLYQRGLSIAKAIDCFNQAVAIDPRYAQAWAGLADGYTTSGYSGFQRPAEVMPLAHEAARKSLELDSNLAEAHNAFACATLLYDRNYELAGTEFKAALSLNPQYPQAMAWYGLFFLHWVSGRETEAREELLRAIQIDPLSAYAHVIFSFCCSSSGNFSEAVDYSRTGVDLDPNSYLAQWSLALSLEGSEDYEAAAASAQRAIAMSGRHNWALTTLASIYNGWNKREMARAVYAELEARSVSEYIQPGMMAIAADAAGNREQAIGFAQQAVDIRDPLFIMTARCWPQYRNLRTDVRFLEVVRQLNLPNWSTPE
jgi:TolB-like protein/Tfp pilus assembly protein PilF